MNNFNSRNDAINFIADMLNLDTDGADWFYQNSECPAWDEDGFTEYDFLSDDCVKGIPEEFVK